MELWNFVTDQYGYDIKSNENVTAKKEAGFSSLSLFLIYEIE